MVNELRRDQLPVSCPQSGWDILHIKNCKDFSGGPLVKNLADNAGDTGLIPGQGTKIPQAMEQLSP